MNTKQLLSAHMNSIDYYGLWKRKKPSEHYNRAYFAEFPDGAKVIIEYNFLREIVKLEYFNDPQTQDFRTYYAIIQRGNILQERELNSQRPISLYSKIQKYRKYFSYLWDEQVLKTIGGVYDIPLKSEHPLATTDFQILQLKKKINHIKIKNFLYYINRFLKRREEFYQSLSKTQRFFYRIIGDIFDILVILVFSYYFYAGKITSFMFSFFSIFYSMFTGLIDAFWRRRPPLIFKTVVLSVPGVLIFFFQYQLHLWGIYEPANQYLFLFKTFLKDLWFNTKNTLLGFLL